VASVERAIRLSPRDPDLYLWYYVVCHAHTHLARDAATIEWCLKSVGTGKMFWHVWVQQMVEDALASSDNATFRKEYERIAEGVRKAGLPER